MERILIIGSGAREHIITKKLFDSPEDKLIFCWGSNRNPGILPLCEEFIIGTLTDKTAISTFAEKHKITLAFIGPELPLSEGLADTLNDIGVSVIGPTQTLAQIESSKAFARNLTKHYEIHGSPAYYHFKNMDGIQDALDRLGDHYVVKANGLMGGKGVKISGEHLYSHREALAYCKEIFNKKQTVVIEEKLEGEEFSLMSFVSEDQLVHMPAVQDHKRAFIGDTGPNTGGMGTYSSANHRLPFLKEKHISAAQEINDRAATALQEGCAKPYYGILYGSFMLTKKGIKLIEFNARFGDPEIMNLLSLLKTDLLVICKAIINGGLDQLDIEFENKATVCKYLVPNGYPDSPVKGEPIALSKMPDNVDCYFGAIESQGNQLIMTGSRAIALVSKADTIQEASFNIEKVIPSIQGKVFHRPDIGSTDLLNQRIKHINKLCHQGYELL